MSDQVPTTFVTEFQNNMRLALNQTAAKVFPYVPMRGAVNGTAGASLVELDDIIGQVQSRKGSGDGRHGDVQPANTAHSRVWIAKPDFDYYAEYVDNNDQVQAKIQLTSGYMQTAVATMNRAKDDSFYGGFFGNMLTGASQAGLVSVPFPVGNVIANDVGGVAGTPTGLNVAKVRAAAKLLGQQFNDADEEAFMIVTADDKDQLLQEALVINIDFGAKGNELQDGKLRRLMGFTFIETESENPLFWNAGLLDAGGGVRKTPFWKKSGVASYAWWETKTSIDRLPQKHGTLQVYASVCVGCTRSDSGKVGYILDKRN
jgi:hypothetical protein